MFRLFRFTIMGAIAALAMPAMAQDGPEPGQGQGADPASRVAAILDGEFPVYDADSSGELDRNEFSKWIMALKQQEMQATGKIMAPDELTAWVSAAFIMADADSGGGVSKAELVRYLGG
ncbi:MAG: EF-hand domain-containing protein [Sphingobium sp.]